MTGKRDFLKDLELIERATPGPWKTGSDEFVHDYTENICQFWDKLEDSFENPENNAEFIAESREGWPHAIKRAIKAERLLRELENTLEQAWNLAYAIDNIDDQKAFEEALAKVKEVLGDDS